MYDTKISGNQINNFKVAITHEFIKFLEDQLKEIIENCLEYAGIDKNLSFFTINKNLKSYSNYRTITDYIFLKLKEYYLSYAHLKSIEYSLLEKNENNYNIPSKNSDYKTINAYLEYKAKNVFKYSKTIDIENYVTSESKNLIKKISEFRKISFYPKNEKELNGITEAFLFNQNNSTEDILKRFYNSVNHDFDNVSFLFGNTPFKYKGFLASYKDSPDFLSFDYLLYFEAFYKNSADNFIAKSVTPLKNLRDKNNNNNIQNNFNRIINSYNSLLDKTNILLNYYSLSNNKNNYEFQACRHFSNVILSNDFFSSTSESYFFQYLYPKIDFKELFNYSKSLYKGNGKQSFKLNKESIKNIENLKYIEVLEFCIKYNLDLTIFDGFFLNSFNGFDSEMLQAKILLDKLILFLYFLRHNIKLLNFEKDAIDIRIKRFLQKTYKKTIQKCIYEHLSSFKNRELDLKKLDIPFKLDVNGRLLFSYLFLYPTRHPTFYL